MKFSWLKFLFVVVLAGASVGIYQSLIHKDDPVLLSEIEPSGNEQIKNLGFSELNHAARIAQQEQQLENIDIDIPVVYQEYDQPKKHVPVQKPSKLVEKYDPNLTVARDQSTNPMFGQLPFDQNFSSAIPNQQYQDPYPYEPFQGYQPSSHDFGSLRHGQKSTEPLKKSSQEEESPILSKVEYPKENKEIQNPSDFVSLHRHHRPRFRENTFRPVPVKKSDNIGNDDNKNPNNDDNDDTNKSVTDDSDVQPPNPDPNPWPDDDGWLIRILNKLKNWWNPKKTVAVSKEIFPKFDLKLPVISTEIVPSKDVDPAGLPLAPKFDDLPKKPQPKAPSKPKPSTAEPITTKNTSMPKALEFYDPFIRMVESKNQKLKNNLLENNETNADITRLPQKAHQLGKTNELTIPDSKTSSLKIKRLTDEELIAREMDFLGLQNQEEPLILIEKPYELRSEQDPFGQIYFIKNSSTGEILSGTAEEIQEYLKNRSWWQKIKDAARKHYKGSSNEYKPLENSDGPVEEVKEPLTDEQRADQAIDQLFEGPGRPTVEDVTKSIVEKPASGPTSLSESVLKIAENTASELASLASHGGSVRIPA